MKRRTGAAGWYFNCIQATGVEARKMRKSCRETKEAFHLYAGATSSRNDTSLPPNPLGSHHPTLPWPLIVVINVALSTGQGNEVSPPITVNNRELFISAIFAKRYSCFRGTFVETLSRGRRAITMGLAKQATFFKQLDILARNVR